MSFKPVWFSRKMDCRSRSCSFTLITGGTKLRIELYRFIFIGGRCLTSSKRSCLTFTFRGILKTSSTARSVTQNASFRTRMREPSKTCSSSLKKLVLPRIPFRQLVCTGCKKKTSWIIFSIPSCLSIIKYYAFRFFHRDPSTLPTNKYFFSSVKSTFTLINNSVTVKNIRKGAGLVASNTLYNIRAGPLNKIDSV